MDSEQRRFTLDLEFVQCLANPAYLHHLAQQGYFQKPAMISYLRHLCYWMRPEYAVYVMYIVLLFASHLFSYPQALTMLQMLQDEEFRDNLAKAPVVTALHRQQFLHWAQYRQSRTDVDVAASQTEWFIEQPAVKKIPRKRTRGDSK